jgi:hypothetical protein
MSVFTLYDFTTALTTDTTAGGLVSGASDRMTIMVDGVAGQGSGWTVDFNYVSPEGGSVTVADQVTFSSATGTTTLITATNLDAAFEVSSTFHPPVPFPNQIVITQATAGTNATFSGRVLLVTPD